MNDSENPNDEEQYHLKLSADDVAPRVLLPGDPDRVDTISHQWDATEEKGDHREYRTVTGRYDGTPLSVTSTGIGSPSTVIALEELARLGVETAVRVGSCGVVEESISVGELIITTGAVRQEGTSKEYVREEYPAVASYEVVSALIAAAEELGHSYHTGVTLSTDSFYAGQARPGLDGYQAQSVDSMLTNLRSINVKNIEMEAASLLAVANVYGLRAGAVCTAYANRETGEFISGTDTAAAETASLALHLLAKMDEKKAEHDCSHWNPFMSLTRS